MSNRKHKTMLSEHFSLEELTYSRIAVENGLDNEPSPAVRQSLCYLAVHLLEPLRQFNGRPIAVLSGYRSDSVNRLAGGVATSQHPKGEAVDCYIPEGPRRLLDILKKSGLLFDQAILYKQRNFLHLSLKEKGTNRMQILFYMSVCLFFFSCCVTRKHNYESETVNRVITEQEDSLLFKESAKRTVAELQEYKGAILITITELSKPDSSGKQYIAKAAQINIHSEQKRSAMTDENIDTQHVELSVLRKDEGFDKKVTDHLQVERRWALAEWLSIGFVIALVCGGVWIIKKGVPM